MKRSPGRRRSALPLAGKKMIISATGNREERRRVVVPPTALPKNVMAALHPSK
jgi:hypothetical protein